MVRLYGMVIRYGNMAWLYGMTTTSSVFASFRYLPPFANHIGF